MNNEIIVLAADHNGVELKEKIYNNLKDRGYFVIDIGPYTADDSVDYVDYAYQLGHILNTDDADRGILICGTGVV